MKKKFCANGNEGARLGGSEKIMKDILTAPFLSETVRMCSNMYRLGWDERNGGNISLMLEEDKVSKYLNLAHSGRVIDAGFDAPTLVGKLFLITGTGKYFKNVEVDPACNLGIVRMLAGGKAEILWGYTDGGRPTSEFAAHLMSHAERLAVDPAHRVIMHCHATNTVAMTYVHDLDERAFTRTLWRMATECMVVFPDGIATLPWMVCGNNEIGRATADKMKTFRLVVWANHGIFGAGKTLDEAFGLIETVEKAAQVYISLLGTPIVNTISDAQLQTLADAFHLTPRAGWLEL